MTSFQGQEEPRRNQHRWHWGSSKGKKAKKEARKFRAKHPHFTLTRFCYIQPQHLLHLTLGFIFNRCHCTFLSWVVMERWASTGTSWAKCRWCLLPSHLPTLSHQGHKLYLGETPQNRDPHKNSHHCAQPKPLRSSQNSFLTKARNLWAQVLGILPTCTRPKKIKPGQGSALPMGLENKTQRPGRGHLIPEMVTRHPDQPK